MVLRQKTIDKRQSTNDNSENILVVEHVEVVILVNRQSIFRQTTIDYA
jgi:hypothetical protein